MRRRLFSVLVPTVLASVLAVPCFADTPRAFSMKLGATLTITGHTGSVTGKTPAVGKVVVSGRWGVAGGCTSGDQVTIISHAFAPAHTFAGVPAVFAQVGSAGRFSAKTRIPATRGPGTYLLTARCGGGNLGVSAHLTVRP